MRVLITGATDGLGRHLAGRLAADGAHVVAHGRNAERLDKIRDEVQRVGGRIDTVRADLAELAAVDELADEVIGRFDRLDVLVNNAGVGFGAPGAGREESADGIELRFAVNYLAGYRLTHRLKPLLVASAPARVVNVASAGQEPVDIDDPMLLRDYHGVAAYRRSKLAQIMFTFDLAEELAERGVTVNALHPATFMNTSMVTQSGVNPVNTVEEGAAATLRLISGSEVDGVTGRYFNGTTESRANRQAYDPAARRRLRDLTLDLLAGAGRSSRP